MTNETGQAMEWHPIKKALWAVLMDEDLNAGHYIEAFALCEKLFQAALKHYILALEYIFIARPE